MPTPAQPLPPVEPGSTPCDSRPAAPGIPPDAEDTAQTLAWLRLITTPGIGPVAGRRIAAACGGPEAVWRMDMRKWQAVEGIGKRAVKALAAATPEHAEAIIQRCNSAGIRMLNIGDEAYPALLRHTDDAPLVLFIMGQAEALQQSRMLAVVGARKADAEGKLITRRWCARLAELGTGIVSGMAFGIDSAAHGGALDAGSDSRGRTVAVLGCGLATPFSPVQQRQITAITESGCVLSEFLPEETPRPRHFPQRNRIIAGLCHATLVMQADIRSGSLITARMAADYGREVMAVPGSPLSGRHAGCHQLLRDGATLIESPDDILAAMRWQGDAPDARDAYLPSDPREAEIMRILGDGALHIDALAERCGLTVSELSPILLGLELLGVIDSLPGSRYAAGRGP